MSNAPESALNEGEIREELEKTLRPLEVLALALGAIVGWGCFVLPAIRFLQIGRASCRERGFRAV